MSKSSKSLRWLNHCHFLKIYEGRLIFWDYKTHSQFDIEPQHLARLIEFSGGSAMTDSPVDLEIQEAGVLTDTNATVQWGWDWLSHIFHFGTCHPLPPESGAIGELALEYSKSYLEFCESLSSTEPEIELLKGGRIIELPVPDLSKLQATTLWEALEHRRTCRDFDGSSASLSEVASILFAAFGDQKAPDLTLPDGVRTFGFRRTSPAAGGLQCTEPYLWVINVNGLVPGIYHYLSCRHQLEVIAEGATEHPIGTYLCNQHWANDMAFAVVMTCRFDKMWWKYRHSRAYRPMLMEVGHLSQTLNLCITAAGLHPWLTGYFHDKELAELVGCTPEIEHPILIVGAGGGTGSSLTREERQLMADPKDSK
jgi:SagB-type dehydrogenase family enzyme